MNFFPFVLYRDCSFFYVKPAFVCACASCFFAHEIFFLLIPWRTRAGTHITGPALVCACASVRFPFCSDTVMGLSWCYADWTRICLRMPMMLFTHEIFFSLLRYRDGLELMLQGLYPHFFAHAHDAFLGMKSFSNIPHLFAHAHRFIFPLLRYLMVWS